MPTPLYPRYIKYIKYLFLFFSIVTIIFILFTNSVLVPLEPGDIVKFELAKTERAALAIINEWKAAGKFEKAVESINLDNIFVVLYSITISLGCRFFSIHTRNKALRRAGLFFSSLIFVGGICDVIENISMAKSLATNVTAHTAELAYMMAGIKFTIIIVCLIFILVCFLIWLMRKFQQFVPSKK